MNQHFNTIAIFLTFFLLKKKDILWKNFILVCLGLYLFISKISILGILIVDFQKNFDLVNIWCFFLKSLLPSQRHCRIYLMPPYLLWFFSRLPSLCSPAILILGWASLSHGAATIFKWMMLDATLSSNSLHQFQVGFWGISGCLSHQKLNLWSLKTGFCC